MHVGSWFLDVDNNRAKYRETKQEGKTITTQKLCGSFTMCDLPP